MTMKGLPRTKFDIKLDSKLYRAAPRQLQRSPMFNFFVLAVKTVCLVLFYYCFSISLTFYNKWLLKDFHFPLTVTIIHLSVKFVIAAAIRKCTQRITKQKCIILGWSPYLKKVMPTGIASAFDIGLSNWSFVYITVSLYTMSKSSCVVFILLFAIAFGLQKPHLSQVLIVLFIAIGLFMFTYESTQFNLEGFIMVLVASVIGGLRWTLAQILTQKEELGLRNPVDTIYHLQPVMIVGLLPLSVIVEGVRISSTKDFLGFTDVEVILRTSLILLAGASLAFMLALSEYLLLSKTSSLTLSISGIIKEIITLFLASEINSDKFSLLNIFGIIMCLAGISLHVIFKASKTNEQTEPVHHIHTKNGDSLQMLLLEGSEDDDEDDDIYDARTKTVTRL